MAETDLHADVRALNKLVAALDTDVSWYRHDYDENGPDGIRDTLEADLIALAALEEARRNLAGVAADLTNVLAKSMADKLMVVEGVGSFERSKKKARTQWDREALLPDVLDTILVDKESGEILPETELEKVLKVWNLPAPRTTVLRDRGLDPDQYCQTEDAGWSIRLIN